MPSHIGLEPGSYLLSGPSSVQLNEGVFRNFHPEGIKLWGSLHLDSIRHCLAQLRMWSGRKVVTPLTPTDWKLIFDGETVSLSPSIGNWSFEFRPHYWILRNHVKWARRWIEAEVDEARTLDRNLKRAYYEEHSGESTRRRKSP